MITASFDVLASHFADALGGSGRAHNELRSFFQLLYLLSGSEIEGQEVSLGLALRREGTHVRPGSAHLVRSPTSARAHDRPITLIPEVDQPDHRGAIFAEHLKDYLREQIVPWAPGGVSGDLALVDLNWEIEGFYNWDASSSRPARCDAHSQYAAVSEWFDVVWLKPGRSIRLYIHGALAEQYVGIRDGLGWSRRCLRQVTSYLIQAARTGLSSVTGERTRAIRETIEERLVLPALSLSERPRGGAAYVVDCTWSDWQHEVLQLSQAKTERDSFVSHFHAADDLPGLTPGRTDYVQHLMEQDGALVMNIDGVVLSLSTYFVGEGGRKAIAQSVVQGPLRGKAMAVVVSQDGAIEVVPRPSGQTWCDDTRYQVRFE